MRFLHLADVHLDTPFAGRSPALRRRLRQASREGFRAAVDCALSESVDAVLIAGDLFDGERLSFGTELFLIEQLTRLADAGIAVVYACGNHDPGREGLRRVLKWPGNVTVVEDGQPRRVAVARGGSAVGFVTAAGHAGARETSDLARTFPLPPCELPEVALLHTQVHGSRASEMHHDYAPSHLPQLRDSGYHYWALGHVHTRQCLSDAPAIHYPGNLQGRSPRERGAKGGLLVDLSARERARVEFRPFAPVRFESLEVRALEDAATLSALIARVERTWQEARTAEGYSTGAEWIVRVVLSGPTPLARELEDEEERSALADELHEALGALDVVVWTHATRPRAKGGDHRERQDVLGEALRLLEEVRSGRTVLPGVTHEQLAGAEAREHMARYIGEVLAGAEGELLDRMLAER
jgi:DNA repair exonuclease SbcCD nuclease subunit